MESSPSQRKEPTKAEHTISAYADESVTSNIIVYAAAVFPIDQVSSAETGLASMKEALGLASTTPLHCRIVFNAHARRGTAWESVSLEAINSAIMALCRGLALIGYRPVAFISKPSHIVIPSLPEDQSKGVPLDEKGQAAIGFQVLSFYLTNLYGYGAAKLWIDPDKTKIPWLNGKTQPNFTRSSFMDLGPDIEPPQSESIIEIVSKPLLLEIADLYRYITAKVHKATGGRKDRWFQELYSIINPERLLWSEAKPDPKWEKA